MKTILVTGATRGIGLAISQQLLTCSEGYRVIGLSRQTSPAFEELIESSAGRVEHFSFDMLNLAEIPAIANQLARRYGNFWGLVNNAGVYASGVLAAMHKQEIERVITVNLLAPMALTKYVSRGMLVAHQGRIVNISSIVANSGFHGLSAYAASKAGLEGMTRSLARELGKRKITVNCVAPGFVDTDMTKGIVGGPMDAIREHATLGLTEPSDVACAVAYLMSDGAARVTGRTLTVDGGSTA